MKIFYITNRWDYGRGWRRTGRQSCVYDTTYLPLIKLGQERGHTIRPFWVDEVLVEHGKRNMNISLRDAILNEKPDVCLFDSGIEEDFDKEILGEIRQQSPSDTVYIGGDDSWEFDSRSKHFALYFSWIATCYSGAVKKYKALGCRQVVSWQSGANLDLLRPVHAPKDIDVSFVGTYGPPRGKAIDDLERAGIKVLVRGNGWPGGGVSLEEMISIISRSKISLCLNPPSFYVSWRSISRLFLRRARLGEGGLPVKLDVTHLPDNMRMWWQKKIRNIKSRHFEIPALGALQMTEHADNLEDYFIPGKEIIFYENTKDLVDKIHYYLTHEEEREEIARRGYERTLRDHSRDKRLYDLFSSIGHPL